MENFKKNTKKAVVTALIFGLMISASPSLPYQSRVSGLEAKSEVTEDIEIQEIETEDTEDVAVEDLVNDQATETVATNESWAKHAETAWYYNNETANTYTVKTAADLAGLAYLVNYEGVTFEGKTITLEAENNVIDLGAHYWVPIGLGYLKDENKNPKNVFKGNFDGKNATIENMLIGKSEYDFYIKYQYYGLFGYVAAGSISNVNIGAGSHIYTFGEYTGGICAYANAQKGTTITISNCSTNKMQFIVNHWYNSISSDTRYLGGICAYANAQGGTININNCSNDANISIIKGDHIDQTYAGGICAYANAITQKYTDSTIADSTIADGTINITNCSNTIMNISSDNLASYAGGICAFANTEAKNRKKSNPTATINITNCINIGEVKAELLAGGICAKVKARTYTDHKGIVKFINKHINDYNSSAKINISNSINAGEVISNVSSAGGICAEAETQTTTESTITISDCYYKASESTSNSKNAGLAKHSGNGTVNDSSIAIPNEQMIAIIEDAAKQNLEDITFSNNNQDKIALLVDALNEWVKNKKSGDSTLPNQESDGVTLYDNKLYNDKSQNKNKNFQESLSYND